ncbi:hypothetical protein [Streptacidiphilus cavernicola]|uniref:Spore-associated protein A n=1 Tax=Streptacidiphilus cavernicola TaxID=3342716 RepID=A0ABV6VVY9_9ACTN
MKTRILGLLAPLAMAVGCLVAVPTAAHATGSICGGYTNIVYANRYNDSKGNPMATIYVYTKGGAVDQYKLTTPTCAILYAEGAYSGESKYMGVTLCSDYVAVPCTTDHGTYKSYAGPVYQAHGGCGSVTYVMKNTAGTTIVSDSSALGCD